MNKKVLIALAALFVVALIGQFMFSIYSNLIDKSSYTDWISAFCNIIMTGATVVAVVEAKKYLQKSLSQDGYKIALSLLNDKLLKTTLLAGVINKILFLQSYIQNYRNIDDFFEGDGKFEISNQERNILIKMFDSKMELDKIFHQNIFNINQEIQLDIFRMKNTGTDFNNNEYGVFLKSHFEHFGLITRKFDMAMNELRGHLGFYCDDNFDYMINSGKQDYYYDTSKISAPVNGEKYRAHLDEIYNKFDELVDLINQSRSNFNKIAANNKTIIDYFAFSN
ncbi:hypothetical protein ACQIBV_004724 [Yersinia enterocolitica]|uniref:hypothetical protein n=3 Tax=Yersinia enterocolitica TaxID=630 RepID=UPI002864860D|nr:hypothetical protein [Yersinia enterocolitica]EKN3490004.1 hypothetical protein [Yersinia enterocolitica]EKN3502532.1 hypothetical protein [Yersinia enterocolitica]EKN3974084.1 hypothetical protein [Yersinia enterocolitica]EKN4008235.1 hypothetical protein [Yersinia enterocolitica]